MRILVLSRWFPSPPDNGAKLRVFNLLGALARRHEVSLVTFHGAADRVDAATLAPLRERCRDVRTVPYVSFRPSSARALRGFLSRAPRFLVDTHSPALQAAVAEALATDGANLLIASELDMVPYALRTPGLPAILEELEVAVHLDAARRPGRLPTRLRASLTWWKLRAYLRANLPRFAACTVVSEAERLNVLRAAPTYSAVSVLPNAIDLGAYREDFGSPEPDTVVFAGALTYSANLDAVRFFLAEVWPLVRARVPAARVRITGRHDGVDLAGLPLGPGAELTGYLADVRPTIARSWLSVVPLRVGGGTRLKILESLALGTPVVSTGKGAEGLDVAAGRDQLRADEPGVLADRIVELLGDPVARARLSAAGRRLVAERYDWQVVGDRLLDLVERVTARPGPS